MGYATGLGRWDELGQRSAMTDPRCPAFCTLRMPKQKQKSHAYLPSLYRPICYILLSYSTNCIYCCHISLTSLFPIELTRTISRLSSFPQFRNTKMPLNALAIYPAADPEFISFPSRRSVVHSTKGIVSSSQPLASNCGLRVLQQGGNCAVS